ncbi:hypothetical protein LIER_28234 [Lithospermum erythrorhizon]|uniref:RNase H type-1 domain-containing protein n=1 Tax=Lithospermum erythrorhizon TaxID=34254 RepID=A0AAV3RHZ4_LITER
MSKPKAVKGQVLADFLADHPLPVEWEFCDELPDGDVINVEMIPPCKMYFDSAAHQGGLEAATNKDIYQLEIYGDSQLVINQLLRDYEVRKHELIPYHVYAKRLLQSIELASIRHVPRKKNKQADALARLASSLTYPGVPPLFEAQEYEEGGKGSMAITNTSGATAD